jgi:hypothetical protein
MTLLQIQRGSSVHNPGSRDGELLEIANGLMLIMLAGFRSARSTMDACAQW